MRIFYPPTSNIDNYWKFIERLLPEFENEINTNKNSSKEDQNFVKDSRFRYAQLHIEYNKSVIKL